MNNEKDLKELSLDELRFYTLSPGQRDILFYLIQGCTYKEIAHILKRGYYGVKNQISMIYKRTNTESRAKVASAFRGLKTKDIFFESNIFIVPSKLRVVCGSQAQKMEHS